MGQAGRRRFLIAASTALAAAPLGRRAQPAGRVARVGFLANTPPTNPAVTAPYKALLAELRSLGWVEGRNLKIEPRYAEGHAERYSVLAADLVDAGVDVLIAAGPQGTEAARNATRSIPIVMAMVNGPVELGYVASLARPGGNITGVADMLDQVPIKNLELLLEIVPSVTKIGILWAPRDPGSARAFKLEQAFAEKRGLREESFPIVAPDDIDRALELARQDRIEGLRLHPTGVIFQEVRKVATWAMQQHVPSIGGPRAFAEAGTLASYNPDHSQLFRSVAHYVDRILRGANPAEMPVEQADKFLLVLNLKTAKAIGVAIPPSLLTRADEVIE
jgi:putative ABC transport system substrate-binding protein